MDHKEAFSFFLSKKICMRVLPIPDNVCHFCKFCQQDVLICIREEQNETKITSWRRCSCHCLFMFTGWLTALSLATLTACSVDSDESQNYHLSSKKKKNYTSHC